MKTYLKLELKKTIFSWRTIISMSIILSSFIVPLLKEIAFPYPGLDGVDYFIRISGFSFIGFIGPVVAGLIYSTSIIKDKESGFMDKLLEVIDIKTYFKVKLVVNTLINSIVFAISYGIILLYLVMNFGISNGVEETILNGGFIKGGTFIGIYDISKVLYIITIFLVAVISAVAFSTLMIGITTASKKKLTAYILPIFYVILTGILFEMWFLNGLIDFNVARLFNLVVYRTSNGFSVLLYNLILTLLGIGLIYRFGYKKLLLQTSFKVCYAENKK